MEQSILISGSIPTTSVAVPPSAALPLPVNREVCPQGTPILTPVGRPHSKVLQFPSKKLTQGRCDSAETTVNCEPESPSQWKAATMARRRYQRGSVTQRGQSWEGRWKEDVIEDGVLRRIHRSKVLGTIQQFPTKRLARRELDRVMNEAGINSEDYQPSLLDSFHAFAEEWKRKVVSTMAVTTQAGFGSELRAWDNAFQVKSGDQFVSMPFREINGNWIQTVISGWNTGKGFKKAGEKTIKNRVGTLKLAWKWARDWGYTRAPFPETLRLPYWDREEAKSKRPAYSIETVKEIMESSEFPYNLIWWLTFETHIRRGEICGLDVGHIIPNNRIITIRRNRVLKSVVKNTKARRPRTFSISAELAEALRPLIEGRKPDEPLFLSPDGKRLHPENLVKRELKPILAKLGVYAKGTACHGFRHGAATKLDELGTPMATRLQRLGHVDSDTTMGYTHAVNEQDRKVSDVFGKSLSQAFTPSGVAKDIPQQLSLQLLDSEAAA